MKIYKVNDIYYFCESKSTRSGFAHIVQIKNKYFEDLAAAKINYYNRTWEKYDFQSVMRKAQENLEKQIKRAKRGQVFLNYRYEDWSKYDFEQEPPLAVLA